MCVHEAQRIGKRTENQFPAYSPWLELPEQVGRSLVLRKPSTEVLAEEKKCKTATSKESKQLLK